MVVLFVFDKFNTHANMALFQNFACKLIPEYSKNGVDIERPDNSNQTTSFSSPSSAYARTANLSQDSLNKCGVNDQKVVAILYILLYDIAGIRFYVFG